MTDEQRLAIVRRNNPKHYAWYMTLPEYTAGTPVCCPTRNPDGTPIDDEDLPGCGSSDTDWDGEVYDCRSCGIFFSDYAADPPHRRTRQE